MSTVNPAHRWWRRERPLRNLAIALWIVSFFICIALGWAGSQYFAGGVWSNWGNEYRLTGVEGVPEQVVRLAEILFMLVLLPLLAASAADFGYRYRAGQGPAWFLAYASGIALLGGGIGGVIASTTTEVSATIPIVLAVLGAAVLAIHPICMRIKARRTGRQAWSRMRGTLADAVVTQVVTRTTSDVNRWEATLQYVDDEGTTRWHRAAIPFSAGVTPKVGQRYELRYDPDRPGRRSSIYVDLGRPKKWRSRGRY